MAPFKRVSVRCDCRLCSVVGKIRWNLREDRDGLINILFGHHQRRNKTKRIRRHRVDDQTVLQRPIHRRMRTWMGKFDRIEQATSTHGDEKRITAEDGETLYHTIKYIFKQLKKAGVRFK